MTTTSQATPRSVPPQRNPSIPLTARVSVELGFVQSCPDCRAIVEQFSKACINDASVTRFVATPGTRHAHDVLDGERALPLEDGRPISDTNGSSPALVYAAQASDDLFIVQPEVDPLNGFDPPGRE